MVMSSEYIQITSATIYAAALFITIITFRRAKRLDQITLSDNIFKELRNLDLELAKVPPGSQYDGTRSQWYYRIFNTLNWLSFMINEKLISDKKLIAHIKPVIANYYEDTFMKNISVGQRDSKFYQEFTKLYRTIKKQFLDG